MGQVDKIKYVTADKHSYTQSSKRKFEFTGPNQILEFIIIKF